MTALQPSPAYECKARSGLALWEVRAGLRFKHSKLYFGDILLDTYADRLDIAYAAGHPESQIFDRHAVLAERVNG